jgi:hypothetical protein
VSAREELLNEVISGLKSGDFRYPGDAVADANGLIDAFAHELAEQVMALRANLPDLAARPAWKAGYDAALVMAALTIDPAKEGE